jgi:arginyl-tRNA synthetase
MYLDAIKNKLSKILGVSALDFVYPPQTEMGELSLPLFNLAKSRGLNPVQLAQDLVGDLNKDVSLKQEVFEIKAVGPYLNFYLQAESLLAGTINDIKKSGINFGKQAIGKNKGIMLEYSNANTHKEYHIGHLRNLFYGDAVTKILSFCSYNAIPVSYINDFGIHVAKTLWAFQNGKNKDDYQKLTKSNQSKGYLLGKCYVDANQELSDFPEKKDEVTVIMKEIEIHAGANYELWQDTRAWSIAYFAEIYQHFNIKFEHIFYESEVVETGLKLVQDFLTKGILKKSQGAIIADLEEYDLGVLPIIRSDGTALYPVADLALARKKFKKYKIEESVYVVDIRQGLYFKQLAKIFELAGDKTKISHLGYDFVALKNGMMSSRSGNVITYNQIWEEAYGRAEKEVASRHEDWSGTQIKDTANALAVAALKFEMLKVSADKIIIFDVDEALRFEGYTAAYLQYSGARLASILRKGKHTSKKVDFSCLNHVKEISLAIFLERFADNVLKAGEQRDPAIISRYLFELAQQFNDYYHEVSVLKAETKTVSARLALLGAIQQVLKNGFSLLGISYLEEM